jgi:hypothetical protein
VDLCDCLDLGTDFKIQFVAMKSNKRGVGL